MKLVLIETTMVTGVVAFLRPKWRAQSLEWTIQLMNAGSTIQISAESIAQNASAATCFRYLGEAVALSILDHSRKLNLPLNNLPEFQCAMTLVPCYFNSNMVLGHYPNPRHLYMLYVQICASNVYIYIYMYIMM